MPPVLPAIPDNRRPLAGSLAVVKNGVTVMDHRNQSNVVNTRVLTDAGKSWNLKVTFSSPGKSWNQA